MKLTILDRSWLASGHCVYPTAMHYSTGGRLVAATLMVADRAVSLRLTGPQVAGQTASSGLGDVKVRITGVNNKEERSHAAGLSGLWKTLSKGTGKLGRLGQVLWERHRPSEEEVSSPLI
ncbi:hypothetical protein Q8A73_016147 [Channa argus]|nr:hypothetical protein Q8A73_016147 [Channa argus]